MKPKTMKRIIYFLVFSLFLGVGFFNLNYNSPFSLKINKIEEVKAWTCPFTSIEGRTIVNFDTKIRSDKDFEKAHVSQAVNLPAGRYKITTFSYDGYSGRENTFQPNEIWIVILKNNGITVAQTRPTTDLKDYVGYDEKIDVVEENLNVSLNVNSIDVLHPRYPDTSSPNSVYVGCIAFDFITPPVVDIKANNSDGPITIPHNSSANLTWTSQNATSCTASGDWSGTKSISGSQSTGNLTSSKIYILTCSGPGGSAQDSVTVNVTSPSLSVSLSASPASGCAPLTGVDLRALVSGTASGDITYFFDCQNDGIWEKIITSSLSSYYSYDLCNFAQVGIFQARVKVERNSLVAENTTQINVYSCYSPPTVDIKANNSDGPITIPYNTSATLSWSSSNADSCTASSNWLGTKSLSGSESTGNLTSSKTYTITCTGSGGSASDRVIIYVANQVSADFSVEKTVKNLSDGTAFLKSVSAEPGEVLIFRIKVKAGNNPLSSVIVKDTLPRGITFMGDLRINNILTSGNILTGLNIGNFVSQQEKTITFRADVLGPESFVFGQTRLVNSASVSSDLISRSDTTEVMVTKAAVAGAVTAIPTGLTNNILFDSFLIPLIIALLIIWFFKSRILKFEEWLDDRKKQYQEYKSKKLLNLKIAKIKTKEFLKNRLF